MANPTPYDPTYEYGGATNVIPGDQLDNDFAKLKVTTDQIIAALGDLRRSDGKINNGVVTADSLDPDLKHDLYNEFTEGAAGLVDEAEAWANEAQGYATDAAAEKTAAEAAKNDAISAKNDAVSAKEDAQAAKADAEQAVADAQQIASNMQDAVDEWLAAAPWVGRAIGEPFPIFTHLGAPTPPTDNPNFRFVKLTASDSYNDGVLVNESVSGSAPLVQATAVIDFEASPLHGQTVRLINTERRVLRAGSSGTVEADQLQDHRHGFSVYSKGGTGSDITIYRGSGSALGGTVQSDGSRVGDETRMKNIGADYYMRIY